MRRLSRETDGVYSDLFIKFRAVFDAEPEVPAWSFPSWLPAAAREHAVWHWNCHRLISRGSAKASEKRQQELRENKAKAEDLRAELASGKSLPDEARSGLQEDLSAFALKQTELHTIEENCARHSAHDAEVVAALERLVTYECMEEAYRLLTEEESGAVGEHGLGIAYFILAAWQSWYPFGDYREHRGFRAATKALVSEIGEQARGLARLLRKSCAHGVRTVIEDQWLRELQGTTGREEGRREPPTLANAIEALERAAESWEPGEDGFMEAATSTRTRNPKTDYLRAFIAFLEPGRRFKPTQAVKTAIRIAADVVLNPEQGNSEVTKREVTNALEDVEEWLAKADTKPQSPDEGAPRARTDSAE